MTAEMTLSGKGYEKLFPGTAEQAENADEARFCFFHEDAEGKYAYTFPVGALDQETDCAAYSFKKQRWYDRTLIFESDSLPDEAFVPAEQETTDGAVYVAVLPVVVAVIILLGLLTVGIVIIKRK